MIPDYALYQKELFVGRKEELELVDEKVQGGLCGDIGFPSVIHWYGIRGIGKTWLLAEIARRYRERLDVVVFKHNFARDGFLAEAFVEEVKGRTEEAVVLVLFEAADYLPEREWLRIEGQVLEPIFLTNRVVVVVTSRRRIHKWNRFRVRRRILAERLGPLSDFGTPSFEEVQELLRNWRCDQTRAEVAPGLVCGHPYAVQVLAQTPQEDPSVILSEVVNRILEEAPAEHQLIVEALAPLRVFGVESMRPVLAEAVNPSHAEASDGRMLDLIGDLQGSGFVEWNTARARYTVVPPLRCLLHRKLELTRMDELRRWHQAALDFLLERLQRLPTHAAIFLREIPYHTVWAKPEQAAEDLEQIFDAALVKENFEGDEANELLQALRADTELSRELEICLQVLAHVESFATQ